MNDAIGIMLIIQGFIVIGMLIINFIQRRKPKK